MNEGVIQGPEKSRGANCLRALASPDARRNRPCARRCCGPRPATGVRRLRTGARHARIPGGAEGRGPRRARRWLVPRRRGRGTRDRRPPARRESELVCDLAGHRPSNPDGIAANQRKNAHGVDLNRNFSVGWKANPDHSSGYYPGPQPFSEPESRAVKRLAKRIDPDLSIFYHQPWNQVLGSCNGPDQRAAPLREPREHGVRLPGRRPARGPRRSGSTESPAAARSWSSWQPASSRYRRQPGTRVR